MWHRIIGLVAGPINHVAIGTDTEVVSMTFAGTTVMDERAFRRLYGPTIVAIVQVGVASFSCPRPETYPMGRVIARSLFPRVRAMDCVGLATASLRSGGLFIPNLTTPRALLAWFLEHGYELEEPG